MNCIDFENNLDDYLDDCLALREKRDFLLHQDNCPACRDLLRLSKRLMSDLHSLPQVTCPIDLAAEIINRTPDQKVGYSHRVVSFATHFLTRHPRSFNRGLIAAAAIVLLTLFFAPELINKISHQNTTFSDREVTLALHDVRFALAKVNTAMVKSGIQTRNVIVNKVSNPLNKSIVMAINPLIKEE